jgi:hydrogenase nickel incorporation protein HypA/HybF
MHEWALAEAVVATLRDSLGKRDPRTLAKVELEIGELQAVDKGIFRFALETILEPYGIDAGRIAFLTEKASFLCRRCGRQWTMEEDTGLSEEQKEAVHFLPEASHAFMRCPYCRSADFSVEKGRGVGIKRIEVESEGARE